MADSCGTFADTRTEAPLNFTTSANNAILMGSRSNIVCYSYQDVTTAQQHLELELEWGKLGWLPLPTIKFVPKVTYTTQRVQTSSTLALYPYHIEARGTLVLEWNADGHLIATIPEIRSTLTGTEGDIGRVFRAYLYSGPIAYALAVTLNPSGPPNFGDGTWRKCQGGWDSDYQNCAKAHCGGTLYDWNRWDGEGTPWVKNGTSNPPARVNRNLSWDLGTLETIGDNFESFRVYVYAMATRGYCNSSRAANYVTAAAGFPLPKINICPPTLDKVEMTRDICEYTVGAKLTVGIPTLGISGVNLIVEWVASDSTDVNNVDWGGVRSMTVENVQENTQVVVDIGADAMVPNTNYCFRLRLERDSIASENALSCGHRSLELPDPEWVVPELSSEDCRLLANGDCVPELDNETLAGLQC